MREELQINSPLGKRSFSEPFIRRPVMTLVLTASALLFGVLAYHMLPVNDLPAVDYPVIQVNAGYPGASPETMANNVATPLEKQFMKIPGLELVTSKSTQGFTVLTLQFALDKSIDAAATDVQTAISQSTGSLPTDLPSLPSSLYRRNLVHGHRPIQKTGAKTAIRGDQPNARFAPIADIGAPRPYGSSLHLLV